MTKRRANTFMALAVGIILTQILCTAVVLRGLDRIRKEAAAAAQISAMAGLEMEMKLAEASRPTFKAESITIQPAPLVVVDPWDDRTRFLWSVPPVPHIDNGLRVSGGDSMIVFPARHQGEK